MKRENEGDCADDGGPRAGEGMTRHRWLTGLFLVFCCGHAVFLIYSIIPKSPTRVERGNPVLEFYRLAFSGRQQWNLFDTIPVHHSMDVRFEGESGIGRRVAAGCILPGLKPYPKPEDPRYYGVFYQMAFSTDKVAYRDAYLRKAAELLRDSRGPGAGVDWSLVIDAEYTRTLFHSRRDGQMWVPIRKTVPLGAPSGFFP